MYLNGIMLRPVYQSKIFFIAFFFINVSNRKDIIIKIIIITIQYDQVNSTQKSRKQTSKTS